MAEYIKLGKASEIGPGQAKSFDIGGMAIAVFNLKGTYYAVQDSCSHQGAPLVHGMLGNKSITCEWHGATFDLETGEALSAPATEGVTAFKVRVVDDDLEIEV